MMNKKIVFTSTVIICTMLLASCGTESVNKESIDRSEADIESVAIEDAATKDVADDFDPFTLTREEMLENIQKNCISIGTPYKELGFYDGTMCYTITDANIYNSLSEAGITYDELDENIEKRLTNFYIDNPKKCFLTTKDNFFKENKNDMADGCYFLILDVEAENIDAKSHSNYSDYSMRASTVGCILDVETRPDESYFTTQDEAISVNKTEFVTFDAVYFDLHNEENENNYFSYELKPGEKKSLKVGYLIKPADLSSLYLTDVRTGIYSPGSPYVKLNFSDSIVE